MAQKKINYAIRGYRYAPESFQGYRITPGGHEEQIPLSEEQRSEIGNPYLTKGRDIAFAHLKHVERERERKCRLYMTYGFLTQENPHTYLFCGQVRCRQDATLDKRLQVFKEFKDHLRQCGCKLKTGGECVLDGHYRPQEAKEHYLTANLSRPVIVWLTVS